LLLNVFCHHLLVTAKDAHTPFALRTWSAERTNKWPTYRAVGNWLKWPAWPVVFYKEMDLHMKLQLRMMCTFLQSDLLEMKGDETSNWYFIC
jgi:hypothetical protein